MKKRKLFLFVIIVITFLTACGGGKPDDVSEEMYQNAVYAIKVVDLYLDGEATAKETYDKLDNMNLPDSDTLIDKKEYADYSIWQSIFSLKIDIFGVNLGTTSLSDLKEDRNKLAEAINYKK